MGGCGCCDDLGGVHVLEGFGVHALEHVLGDVDAAVGKVLVEEVLSLRVHATLGMVALDCRLDSSGLR